MYVNLRGKKMSNGTLLEYPLKETEKMSDLFLVLHKAQIKKEQKKDVYF